LPLFFIKPDVFFIVEAPKFYIMRNTKCFYIGLFCLFFTSNIFSQTTVQGKSSVNKEKVCWVQISLSIEQAKEPFQIRMEILT